MAGKSTHYRQLPLSYFSFFKPFLQKKQQPNRNEDLWYIYIHKCSSPIFCIFFIYSQIGRYTCHHFIFTWQPCDTWHVYTNHHKHKNFSFIVIFYYLFTGNQSKYNWLLKHGERERKAGRYFSWLTSNMN